MLVSACRRNNLYKKFAIAERDRQHARCVRYPDMDGAAVSIQVRNLQRKIPINLAVLRQFADRALAASMREAQFGHGRDFPQEIHVLLISDERMSTLHKQFMNQPGPTDVITFHHGEIFISVPTARRQARKFQTSLMRELQLYIVHGLLHLQGFDDQFARDQKQMRAAEARVLRRAAV